METEIGRAIRVEAWLFALFMIATFAAALLTYALWRQGRRVQDLVQAQADLRIEEARKDAAVAQSESATASLNAAEAKKRAAELEVVAEQERLARIKIEERLAPRTISREDDAIEVLRQHAGSTVDLVRLREREAESLANQIIRIFERAGWRVRLTTIGQTSPVYGVPYTVAGQSEASTAVIRFLETVPSTRRVDGTVDQSVVARIFVGLKPPA